MSKEEFSKCIRQARASAIRPCRRTLCVYRHCRGVSPTPPVVSTVFMEDTVRHFEIHNFHVFLHPENILNYDNR
jgi:hypothetical protein